MAYNNNGNYNNGGKPRARKPHKGKKYSTQERQAYWVGVGMAIGLSGGANVTDFSEKVPPNVRKSLDSGFAKELGRKPASFKFTHKGGAQ